MKSYIEKHNKDLDEKSKQIQSMKNTINDLRNKEGYNAEQARKERDLQVNTIRQAADLKIDNIVRQHEEEISNVKSEYMTAIQELKEELNK